MGVHVVGALLEDGAPLDPLDEDVWVVDVEDEDPFNDNVFFEEVGLLEGAGDAVEEEELLVGEVAVGGNQAVDVVVPDLDGHFVGEEVAAAGVAVVELAGGGLGAEGSENVSRREVEVVACAAEELAHSPFA